MIDFLFLFLGIAIGAFAERLVELWRVSSGWPRLDIPSAKASWRQRRRARIARLDLRRALARGRQ